MLVVPHRARLWLLAYAVVAVGDVLAELLRWGPVAAIALVIAMPVLIGALLTSGLRRHRIGRWLLAGLVFSWLGDTLGWFLIAKIGFFLIAQICYVVAFWPYRRRLRRPVAVIIPYALVVAALMIVIAPAAGTLLPAVLVYALAVTSAAVLALGADWVAGLGGAIFVFSDAVIALTVFPTGVFVPAGDAVLIGTYLLAQSLLLVGVWRVVARAPASADLLAVPPPV